VFFGGQRDFQKLFRLNVRLGQISWITKLR
jgi:hypothetical protein